MISFFCRMSRLLSLLCFVLGTATDGQFWQFDCFFVYE